MKLGARMGDGSLASLQRRRRGEEPRAPMRVMTVATSAGGDASCTRRDGRVPHELSFSEI